MTDPFAHTMSHPPITSALERLAALDSYGILDTPPEAGFDDIVQLATVVCDAPVALVSLVTDDRQWFKARVGFQPQETPLGSSICAHALTERDILVIPDLTADPRTQENPLVTGAPNLRFYGGVPLRDEDGHSLGSLCVIDTVPRPGGLNEVQITALSALARQVMALLTLRRSVAGRDDFIARRRELEQHLEETANRLHSSEAHWRGLFGRLSEGLVIAEVIRDDAGTVTNWRYLDVNHAWGELFGIDPRDVIGRTVRDVFPGIGAEWMQHYAGVLATREPMVFTRQVEGAARWYEGRAFALEGERFAILLVETTDRVLGEIRRNALLEVGDQLRDANGVTEMTARATAIVGQALGASRVGYGQIDGPDVVVGPDWTAADMPTVAGRHRLAAYGDIEQGLLRGEPLVIGDVLTDPRTAADPLPMTEASIRSLVNIPIQERGRTVALFIVHFAQPQTWSPEVLTFLHNVADRLTAAVARVKAEADQQLLNEELSHRMKNMLAMVQAIASQTLKGVSNRDAVDGFRERVQALASAHDVLLQTSWATAPLRDVVDTVLRRTCPIERVEMTGPTVHLGSRAALSISLLLHELATNAVKYGAMSVETGRVAITWWIDTATDDLVFCWRERGGPPASEPVQLGFGSRLLQSGMIGTGGVSLRYENTGLNAEMRACLEQVQAL